MQLISMLKDMIQLRTNFLMKTFLIEFRAIYIKKFYIKKWPQFEKDGQAPIWVWHLVSLCRIQKCSIFVPCTYEMEKRNTEISFSPIICN